MENEDEKLFLGDCLEIMPEYVKTDSVDMIFCDLPYGTTSCTWDIIIPFDKLWSEYQRVLKSNGVVVLFGQEPFSSHLRLSNPSWYKYDWYWEKERLTNIAQVKRRAGKTVETISIFYKNQPTYNPQMVKYYGKKRSNKVKHGKMGILTDSGNKRVKEYVDDGFRFPTQILKFQRDTLKSNLHPTQKPLALIEYMIRTYTNGGNLILDNACGSGTTGVGAQNLKRRYILIENDKSHYLTAKKRLDENKSIIEQNLLIP